MLKRILPALGVAAFSLVLHAQNTVFTYQGLLMTNGGPANGAHDLSFTLFDAPTAGVALGLTNVVDDVDISDGLLLVPLDFTAAPFDGSARWLEIAVRPGGSEGDYEVLSPRQPIAPTPYALSAAGLMAPAGDPLDITVAGNRALRLEPTAGAPNFIVGADDNAVTVNARGAAIGGGWSNLVTQSGASIGGGVLNTNAGGYSVIGGGVGNRVGGWYAVVAGGTNNGALARSAALGGGSGNTIEAFAEGATIGGGLANTVTDRVATIGGGSANTASGQLSTVAGGYKNFAGGSHAFIGGGGLNAATGLGSFVGGGGNTEFFVERGTNNLAGGEFSSVVGGRANTASGRHAFVGGGRINVASGDGAVVGGGQESAAGGLVTNNVAAGVNAVVGGGRLNFATGNYSTVPGGEDNQANGPHTLAAGGGNRALGAYSLALGYSNATGGYFAVALGYENEAAGNFSLALGAQSRATHQGAFVWADSSPGTLNSVADDSVTLRAAGGIRFFTDASASVGVSLLPESNSWGVLSDRNRKKDLQPVDGGVILDKLAALPISAWHYDFEPGHAPPHIGPMAQDFKAAFYPGRDDRSITTHEFDGVALAAIQGLNTKVEVGMQNSEVQNRRLEERLRQREMEISGLQEQNAELRRRLEVLEQKLN